MICVVPRERHSVARECLEFLLAFTREPFEIIYIDSNGPGPVADRLAKLAAEHPSLRIIRSDKNLYPYEAKNLAVKHLPADARWVAFVDNDVKVFPGWLDRMIEAAEETGTRAAHPLYLFEHDGQTTIHMAEGLIQTVPGPRALMQPVMNLVGMRLPQVSGLKRSLDAFCEFHVFLLRRDLLEEMGEFEPLTLSEDVHFSLKLRERGEKIVFEPASVVTYVAGPPFETYDLPYFRFRWDLERARQSNEASVARWPAVRPAYWEGKYKWARFHRSRVEWWFSLKMQWGRVDAEIRDLVKRARKKMAGRSPAGEQV